jgi:RimJ/RimL family protein N-acetyltransferase
VTLRALEPGDAAIAQTWINDPEFCRYLRDISFPYSLQAEQEWIGSQVAAEADGTSYTFGIQTEDHKLIGTIGLQRISYKDGHAGMGVGIGPASHRGRGYGSEAVNTLLRFAFGDLRLHKIWLEVDAGNTKAVRCYGSIGFKHEGVMRDHTYRDGRHRDYYMMSILDREFKGWPGGKARPARKAKPGNRVVAGLRAGTAARTRAPGGKAASNGRKSSGNKPSSARSARKRSAP